MRLATVLVGAIALSLGGLWVWAGSEGSLARAVGWLEASQPLQAEGVRGSLRAGGHLDHLVWQQDGLRVDARDIDLAWQPLSLLQGRLQLSRLAAAQVDIVDQRAAPSAVVRDPPTALGLPLPTALDAFRIGQLRWTGPVGNAPVTLTDMEGRYVYGGQAHQLALTRAQLATGRYSGQARLSSRAPLTLEAQLTGALTAALPDGKPLVLSLQARASGPVTDLALAATLDAMPAAGTPPPAASASAAAPQVRATARLQPWAAQPVPQADATFTGLDLAALWSGAPRTLLAGSAGVRPAATAGGWALSVELANRLAGPWDQRRLPLDRLQAQGEWRGGQALVQSLRAQLGGGVLQASGQWAKSAASMPSTIAPAAAPAAAPGSSPAPQAWTLEATLQRVNPAALHSQLAGQPLDGQASVRGDGSQVTFDLDAQAAAGKTLRARTGVLTLQGASALGRWTPQPTGGVLALSALRLRSTDATLSGTLEFQPATRGGKADLTLAAPGLDARIQGALRPDSGAGELSVRSHDAAQALRWLQQLPGLPTALTTAAASGNAQLVARWQGGWRDPALEAQLDIPTLDWRRKPVTAASAPSAVPEASAAAAAPAPVPFPVPISLRAVQATLSGRLSQAQLTVQGRVEAGARRFTIQMAADGGRAGPARPGQAAPLGESAWKGQLQQLSVAVQDPALGSGAWQLTTRSAVPLAWTPQRGGGALDLGAGQALLRAPAASGPSSTNAVTAPAVLAWQAVRWQAGSFASAGTLSGLPLAWLELLAGPQLAGAGLAGNMLFDGAWDITLGPTLQLKASLARRSGDISVQADTASGRATRVEAGVRQAQVSLASDGQALTLAWRWDSERAGTADGQLTSRLERAPEGSGVAGWLWPVDAPLQGQLRAQLPRIGVWSVLAPPGWRLRGALAADVSVSGTREAPQLAGTLQADDLALRSVVDGIEFDQGRLRARLEGSRMLIDEFSLQGAGDKGSGGTLTAQGQAGWIEGQPQVRLNATLTRLRASLRTDRQLTVSGQLQAELNAEQAALTGKLVVDQARFVIPDESTPQLGDDVVVRGSRGVALGQKAPEATSSPTSTASSAAPARAARPVRLALEIDLGPDFRLQGKGIATRVAGSLSLQGESLQTPRLVGTVRTEDGQYRAYGQRLDIEQGVLRFTGPLDNPTLDILAIRPNLTQRVGVQITGTALLPRVRLYAQPELPEAEKLSWLVIGRPAASGGAESALLQQAALALLGRKGGGMSGGLAASLGLDELSYRGASSNASGTTSEGAVTLGKRFSRNFYAAYERSLSGALGTLYVFYDLSQRFTVRAQTGQQSAIDLIYTLTYD